MVGLRRGHNQQEPTFVYVLECAGRVKIGIAANIDRRVADLQMACPVQITVAHRRRFASRTSARLAERSLHQQFNSGRLWGEWFEVDPRAVAEAVDACEEFEVAVYLPRPKPEPVRLETDHNAEDVAEQWKRITARPDGTHSPTFEQLEAMGDEEWLDNMRECAETLDFTASPEERDRRIGAASDRLFEKYGYR